MIEIKKNPNGDSRTAIKGISFEHFCDARNMHSNDVKAVMHELSMVVDKVGEFHDYTAKSQARMFYRDFLDVQKMVRFLRMANGISFMLKRNATTYFQIVQMT